MRHSIRIKIILVLTAVITFTVFLTWFINRTFLAGYYQESKIKTLNEVYEHTKLIFERKTGEVFLSEDETEKIEKLSSNNDVNIYIIMFEGKLRSFYPEPKNFGEREELQVFLLLEEYLAGNSYSVEAGNSKELLESTDKYEVYRLYDGRLDANYIDLVGVLDYNKLIFLRANYEGIQESVALSNRFLAYIGILAVAIGTVSILIISNRFTKPVLELAEIAKKMSNLNFDVKYKVTTKDEISELGRSINILSDKLEETITELKQANNELMSDIKKKTEIDEMRKEFLSNVSHELKTPLSLIQGYAEGLMENVIEDEESRNFYCEVILDETDKMNKMVKKMLTLNELEFGNNQVNIERVDIVALISSILEASDILFKQKEVIVRFDEANPIYVWSDEFLVEQVITNYVSNALNHVSGANIIEIKLIPLDKVLRVAVFNTGENIPEDELEKIWVKFYKVDKARTREYGGNGIGLSIVKAIAKTLNTQCGVVNHSYGVEFWFELDM